MSFWSEIERRKVGRVAIAYVLVAWVIIEVASVVEQPLQLPDWFDTMVIVLLGLGFPVALILSWAYDVEDHRIVRDRSGERAPAILQIDYGKIALGAVLLLGGILLGVYLTDKSNPSRSQPRTNTQAFEIGLPANFEYRPDTRRPIAISRDGRVIFVHAPVDGQNKLFARTIGSVDVLPIEGTEGADPGFALSPDGRFIAFLDARSGSIKKVAISGGVADTIGSVSNRVLSMTWGQGGTIVYTEDGFPGLKSVAADGGASRVFSTADEGTMHKHASYVPDTDWLMLAVGLRRQSVRSEDEIALMSPDGELQMTSLAGSSPRVLPDGRLVFFRRNALWSVGFDVEKLEILDEPVPIVDDVYYDWFAHFDVSHEDSLVYLRGSLRGENTAVWVDREGNEEALPLGAANYSMPSVSPDGDILAVSIRAREGPDLWMYSFSQGAWTQITNDESGETAPEWSPDGETLYFEDGSPQNVYRIALGGDGSVEQVTNTTDGGWFPQGLTPDGRKLIIDEWFSSVRDGRNIGVIDFEDDNRFSYLIATDFHESHATLSPDGTLLAYMSDRSGAMEIWVRRYPEDDGGSLRISNSGDCWQPKWNGDSRELYYWDHDDDAIYSVRMDASGELSADQPVPLFRTDSYEYEGNANYDYDPNRDRFLMLKKPPPGSKAGDIVLIQNWPGLVSDATASP